MSVRWTSIRMLFVAGTLAWFVSSAQAQAPTAVTMTIGPAASVILPPPINDQAIEAHALVEQLEDRTTGSSNNFRYEGLAWAGTDYDKLVGKFEGERLSSGAFVDGINELLYSRAISTYFDLQAGLRVDLDSGPGRTWFAMGIQGLAIQWFTVEATAYASNGGHYAAKLNASYDIPVTNRLFLQPQAELNAYSKDDPGRGVGSGFGELDAGLRLRYEITRKFAPYVGVAYQRAFGPTANFARQEGSPVSDLRLVIGLRAWF
jgi:copper resistance protein B